MFAYFRAPVGWGEILRRTVRDTIDDNCGGLAAQLAFYFFLGLFPALLFLLSLFSYLPIDAGPTRLLDPLSGLVPSEVLQLLRDQLDQALQGAHGGVLTLAVATALWSSSTAMTAIIYTLNRAYDIEEFRPWWHTRLLAIALTLALAVFVLGASAIVVAGSDLAGWVAGRLGFGDVFEQIWAVAQWGVAFGLVVFAVDLVYRFAPNADNEWVWITPGSLLATGLWLLTSIGFRLYLRYVSDVAMVTGAIGAVIVFMLWLYLTAFAILVGAELNAEIDRALPSRDTGPQAPGRRKRIGPKAERSA